MESVEMREALANGFPRACVSPHPQTGPADSQFELNFSTLFEVGTLFSFCWKKTGLSSKNGFCCGVCFGGEWDSHPDIVRSSISFTCSGRRVCGATVHLIY